MTAIMDGIWLLLRDHEVHYRVQRILPLIHSTSQLNPANNLHPQFLWSVLIIAYLFRFSNQMLQPIHLTIPCVSDVLFHINVTDAIILVIRWIVHNHIIFHISQSFPSFSGSNTHLNTSFAAPRIYKLLVTKLQHVYFSYHCSLLMPQWRLLQSVSTEHDNIWLQKLIRCDDVMAGAVQWQTPVFTCSSLPVWTNQMIRSTQACSVCSQLTNEWSVLSSAPR
jgi:hypothetical protein